MVRVREVLNLFPFVEPPVVLEREQELLLRTPPPLPGRPADEVPLLEAVHFDPVYVPKPFSPPKYVYQNDVARIEWQDMNGRQPFYHRNLDVDEMSFQVTGPRMLITELGTVDLEPDDFVRIPVGVAHDNWGRQEIHLLFYLNAPVEDRQPAVRSSREHTFDDWQPATVHEMITGPGVTVSQMADERMLVEQIRRDGRRLHVMRSSAHGTTWLWRSATTWIGKVIHDASDGLTYVRHRNADEVQYQVAGRRRLVSQQGTLQIEPGDFVRIPAGYAFTSVHAEPSTHLTLVCSEALRRVNEPTRRAEAMAGELAGASR